jgi:hypothetical protein
VSGLRKTQKQVSRDPRKQERHSQHKCEINKTRDAVMNALRFMGSPQQESQLSSLEISFKAANMLSRDCGGAFAGL